jgi:hypothetical protein
VAKRLSFLARIRVVSSFNTHFFEVPAKHVKALGGFGTRVVCRVGKLKFQAAIQGAGAGLGSIWLNKARLTELGAKVGARLKISLEVDKSEFGMEMPEELEELLRQDEEGNRRFRALTKGKQRNIIHYVSGVKNPDKRLDRAIFLLQNLKGLPEGKESVRGIFGGGA